MRALKPGDSVVVTKLDRLARSSRDLHNILGELEEGACGFVSLGESWCDTTTDVGKLVLTIMGGIAEFERKLIQTRCEEGIAKARAKGTKFGRPSSLTSASAARSPSATPPVRLWPSWRGSMSAARRRSGGPCKPRRRPETWGIGPLDVPMNDRDYTFFAISAAYVLLVLTLVLVAHP